MISCDAVRERLAAEGVEAAELVAEIKHHLDGCADCTKFLGEQRSLESALRDLPHHDAPDAVVAETLRAVRQAAEAESRPARPGGAQRTIAAALAASVVIAAGLGLTYSLLEPAYQMVAANRVQSAQTKSEGRVAGQSYAESGREPASDEEAFRELDVVAQLEAGAPARQRAARATQERLTENSEIARGLAPQEPPAPADAKKKADGGYGNELRAETEHARPVTRRSNKPVGSAKSGAAAIGALVGGIAGERLGDLRADKDAPEAEMVLSDDAIVGGKFRDQAAEAKLSADVSAADPAPVSQFAKSAPSSRSVAGPTVGDDLRAYDQRFQLPVAPVDPDRARARAARFLGDAGSLDGLAFQDPVGYWANRYIPGDPAMRLLQARLAAWDRRALGRDVRLERAVRQVGQPFDGPRDAALAVYLHADAPAIDGPTRLRIQVGLKAAERQGGHRPAMNLGVLVDLRGGVDAEAGARIRALIAALQRARQPGDRFSLTVAGPDGGLLVPPGEFRHGPLRVAMERMFAVATDAAPSDVDLPRAFALATESVLGGVDPNAVLGSSLVLLVTGSSLADGGAEDLAELERRAHRNALGGVPLSVASLAARDDLDSIDRLVAAGQGNRRVLDSAAAADGLIDRELHAASRAVARALRLRIRLAPGVKLVEVVGSRRLEEAQAERVREAEQAIDQRLARNLGIEADRGDDEEGIQIVIPNFYAGDSHTILLDVVAESPGPLADVTLRYKDVIHLRNGVARASLTVDDGPRAIGPLELNVRKNLVAWELSRQSRQVARHLAAGDPRQAAALLGSLRELIHGLRLEVPGWQGDRDLIADEALLEDYLAVLATPAAGDLRQRRYLADSLRYAAFRKLQTAAR